MTTQAYRNTLRSERWGLLKWRRIIRAAFCCERCGRKYRGRNVRGAMRAFHLHHVHYRTVGRERLADVRVLCPICHRLEHNLISEALDGADQEVGGDARVPGSIPGSSTPAEGQAVAASASDVLGVGSPHSEPSLSAGLSPTRGPGRPEPLSSRRDQGQGGKSNDG